MLNNKGFTPHYVEDSFWKKSTVLMQKDLKAKSKLKGHSAGFTLLELLLVIGLLAITAAIAIPNFSMTFENQKFKNFTNELASYLNQARTLAITRLVKTRLFLDEPNNRYLILVETDPLENPDQFEEPKERHLREPLRAPEDFQITADQPNIDFYPDGTTNISKVKLFNSRFGKTLFLKMNKLTGEIRIQDEIK